MRKLVHIGLVTVAALVFAVSCANPYLDSDGDAVSVTSLSAEAGVGSVSLTWTDPDVQFSSIKVKYGPTDGDTVTADVSKGTQAFSASDLTADTEYTFEVLLVAANGVVAEKGAKVTATPEGEFVAPHTPQIIGNGIVGASYSGGGADMTKVSENEWTYEFAVTAAGTIGDFKFRKSGTWGEEIYDITDSDDARKRALGEAHDFQTTSGGNGILFDVSGPGLVTVTFWFQGEDDAGDPQFQIDFLAEEPASYNPEVQFQAGSALTADEFLVFQTNNKFSRTFDVSADDVVNFVIGNSDESIQWGDSSASDQASGTSFDAVAFGADETGTVISYTVPDTTPNGTITIDFYFAGKDLQSDVPEIEITYTPELATINNVIVYGVTDGVNYALPGSDNWLSANFDNSGETAASGGTVTFNVNASDIDVNNLANYEFKVVQSNTWHGIGWVGNGNLNLGSLTLEGGQSYDIHVDVRQGVSTRLTTTAPTAPDYSSFTAPYTPEIIGNDTPGGYGGNPALGTKVSENEWTYEFAWTGGAGTLGDFKFRQLGDWANVFDVSSAGRPYALGTTHHLTAAGSDGIEATLPSNGTVTVTFWFLGENEIGSPQFKIDFVAD